MPTAPCFIVGPRGYISLESTIPEQQRIKLLGALSGFYESSVVYDSRGLRWRSKGVEIPLPRTWWTVLLANTVYNPWITITQHWHEPQPYQLQELKLLYLQAVDQDDDILTQFVEPEDLRQRISAARSFDELVAVYRWMESDHDDGLAA
jgi:hypothetical protein